MALNLKNIDSHIHSFDWIDFDTASEIIQERALRAIQMRNKLFQSDVAKENKTELKHEIELKNDNPEYELDAKAEEALNDYIENDAVMDSNWLLDGGIAKDAIYKEKDEDNAESTIKSNANFVAKRDRFIVPPASDASTTTNDLLRQLVDAKNADALRKKKMRR